MQANRSKCSKISALIFLVKRRFIWVYASTQFALVVLFAHIFYNFVRNSLPCREIPFINFRYKQNLSRFRWKDLDLMRAFGEMILKWLHITSSNPGSTLLRIWSYENLSRINSSRQVEWISYEVRPSKCNLRDLEIIKLNFSIFLTYNVLMFDTYIYVGWCASSCIDPSIHIRRIWCGDEWSFYSCRGHEMESASPHCLKSERDKVESYSASWTWSRKHSTNLVEANEKKIVIFSL